MPKVQVWWKAAMLTAVLSGINPAAYASGSTPSVSERQTTALAPGVVAFAHLPATSESLGVLAESARVHIHRDASADDITVASACPHDWNVTGNMIRQAGFSTKRNGVAMLADSLGSRAIVNGRIYSLPNGRIGGGIQMNKEGLFINGKKVSPIEGSAVPGSCNGPDAVEVIVPDSFSGDLLLGAGESSQVDVDSWKGGSLKVDLLGKASMKAGNLTALSKAAVDVHGAGKVDIDKLDSHIVVVDVNGSGNITIKSGKADVTNATASGSGAITMSGAFKNLEKAVQGDGKIKVN